MDYSVFNMSKQPRQTVRKKIRINEEKSILGTSCPAASTVGERAAHSTFPLLGEKVFKQENGQEAAIFVASALRANPQFILSK